MFIRNLAISAFAAGFISVAALPVLADDPVVAIAMARKSFAPMLRTPKKIYLRNIKAFRWNRFFLCC